MNRIEDGKISAHEKAISEILASMKRIMGNKTLVANIFQSAGISIDDRLSLVSLRGNAETCVNSLMDKLSHLPVANVSARRILRNRGLNGGLTAYHLFSDSPPKKRFSWLARGMK